MHRRQFLRTASGALAAAGARAGRRQPPNLLFIMTDQQRFDALSCAGNGVLRTPNLDRLAREGAMFPNAVTPCPVCVPARTSMLTGKSLAGTGVSDNLAARDTELNPGPSYDNLLCAHGYTGEYYGKWHAPYRMALSYANKVPAIGVKLPGVSSKKQEYIAYLDRHVPRRELKPGELIDPDFDRPYTPAILDARYRDPSAEFGQGDIYGWLHVPKEHSPVAYDADHTLAALDRLKDGPFTLTCSIGPPHPPMVNVSPYWGMYPAGDMPLPKNFLHDMSGSPYRERAAAMRVYQAPENIRAMTSIYYGMVKEVDDHAGRLLKKLDETGLAANTLVIFTSDHGEMMGSHGMHSKMVFYEESVHVPLLMRFPGRIRPGTVVAEPVSTMDLFATLLDFLDVPAPPREGYSLRRLMDGKNDLPDFRVSEWATRNSPNFMVRTRDWKLMMANNPDSRARDALFDLRNDPYEMRNLLAPAERPRYAGRADEMKERLLSWLGRAQSPFCKAVAARKLV